MGARPCFVRRLIQFFIIQELKIEEALAKTIVARGVDPVKLNWSILDLGATVCVQRNRKGNACLIRRAARLSRSNHLAPNSRTRTSHD